MSEAFEPSSDFVDRVMRSVRDYEASRHEAAERFGWLRGIRYLLAGGGTIAGIFTAAPVF